MKKFCSLILILAGVTFIAVSPGNATIVKKPTKLMCYNKSSHILRKSNVVAGCEHSELSLGAMVVIFPAVRPRSLNTYLYARFLAAQSDAQKLNVTLQITSGYRSYESQTVLFRQAVKKYGSEAEASKWVSPPNISHHTWGMALDINYPYNPKPTLWLARNGYKYGLCRAYENEWWHFEALTVPGLPCPARLPNASTTKIN